MYKVKWDEDKWNIHSSSYNSSKYGSIFSNEKNEEVKYHEQRYGSKERSISSDYMRREDSEKERKKEGDSLFEEAEESRNEKNEISEEEMQFEVATQLLA
ncbi:hypothetical protein HYW99_00145, partial [Candidatus Woesearchaeota archaeon]|nr:hypothetical protein [Candidatus Woesearchaeota archaeon]